MNLLLGISQGVARHGLEVIEAPHTQTKSNPHFALLAMTMQCMDCL